MGAQAVRLSNVDIDNALENKDFEVLFQPIFDLGNGALARMETFVRWRHPTLGVLPPGAFISFFETQGRMSELTRYVLAEALNGYMEWRGPYEPGLSINLALTDVSDDAFATHFKKILRDREFPADLITLECPMPPVDVDVEAAAENFRQLRECGARLAIEVRGRANDFLRNIDPFPFDEIKTGGASILRFARTVRGPGLSAISDLLDIANKANAVITAVGVEDQASLAALRGLGFTAAQGNHLSKVGDLGDFRPGRVNEVRELLGLPALSTDDLTALFRTEAPAPKAADAASGGDEETATLIERLHEHTEKEAARAGAAQQTAKENAADEAGETDQGKRAKAREKAKALALAKRAKAREIRKAAAIKRAKAKAAQMQAQAQEAEQLTDADGDAFPPSAEPRALQDRLAQEYIGGDEGENQEAAPVAASGAPAEQQNGQPEFESEPLQQTGELTEQLAAFEAIDEPDIEITPPAAPEEKANEAVSLKVGAAGAHFRPGIRVGAEGLSHGANKIPRQSAAPAAQPTQPNEALDVVPQGLRQESQQQFSFDDGAPATDEFRTPEIAPEAAPAPAPEPAPGEAPEEDAIEQGHLQEEYTLDQPPARKPKSQNFLTRKYKVVPTHFWPKKWKRRYRQWQKDRTEMTAHAEAAE